ncbi:MAG: hypothetical protein SFZ02_00345 [bacterium]|nr:hypothetical protein [bacterium]
MVTVAVRSRVVGGSNPDDQLSQVALDLLNETLTIAELIAHTVEEQIRDLELQRKLDNDHIQQILNRQYLTDAEVQAQAQDGAIKMPKVEKRGVDYHIQTAQTAFQKGVYVIVIDGVQADALDSMVTLKPASKITFLRLTPLVGG